MQRDFDLVRELLIHFDRKDGSGIEENTSIEGYSDQAIAYHLRLLNDAGFVRCETASTKTGRVIQVYPFELTWAGHEFLDHIRSQTRWDETKEFAKDKGITLTFTVIAEIAKKFVTSMLSS